MLKLEGNNLELLVLVRDNKTGGYHEVLLNELELDKIAQVIGEIFWAKKSDIMVNSQRLKIFEVREATTYGKEGSREIQS